MNDVYSVKYSERTKNDDFYAVKILDDFTKAFCIDVEKEDLAFRCSECLFRDGKFCKIKSFKSKFAPHFKEFGAMGDL